MELGVERIRVLLARLDDPQREFRAIHVVGTNGKSSATRFICAALAAHDLRAGAYLSPHITGWNERVLIAPSGGVAAPVDPAAFLLAVRRAEAAAREVDSERGGACTQFEVLTAAAFLVFAAQGVEVAAIEAGLGGRLDATNVLDASVVALTSIALDHIQQLGPSREDAAREKLAVLVPGAVLVAGGMDSVIRPTVERIAGQREASTTLLLEPGAEWEELPELASRGVFQRANATVALEAVAALLGDAFDEQRALAAVVRVVVPGRLELVGCDPLVLRDAAHNPAGAQALAAELPATLGDRRPVVGVLALLADKDVDGVLAALSPSFDAVVATATPSDRALSADQLLVACAARGLFGEAVANPVLALERARVLAGPGGAVVVAGSLTLLGALAGVTSVDSICP